MKAELYRNIDLVQIDIQSGVDEYYFPKNVDWANKKIDKIVLCAPGTACVSPIDGQSSVYTRSGVVDMYLDLYSNDDQEIVHNLSFENILHTNNNPVLIGKQLSLNLSRIYFTTPPASDGVLLFYVFYDTQYRDDYVSSAHNETITFPLAAGEKLTFRQIINTYVHAQGKKVVGIQVWNAENNPAYLTLRDYPLTYILKDVHTEMLRPQMSAATVEGTQVLPCRLDCIDIDFEYSFIRNATGSANTQTITIEY